MLDYSFNDFMVYDEESFGKWEKKANVNIIVPERKASFSVVFWIKDGKPTDCTDYNFTEPEEITEEEYENIVADFCHRNRDLFELEVK
jgi:hypothetical protein